MLVAAIDFGRRWLGLAVADRESALGARPVGAIERKSLRRDIEVLRRRLAELEITHVIVGLPLNMDGSIGPMARAATRFADSLREATGLTVELFDERLTSFEAERRMREMPQMSRRARSVDAIAASVILESWLSSRPAPPGSDSG
jgi:putative Holliday junction resolvase